MLKLSQSSYCAANSTSASLKQLSQIKDEIQPLPSNFPTDWTWIPSPQYKRVK